MKREHRTTSGALIVSELVGAQRWYQLHGPISIRDVLQLAEIACREALEISDSVTGGSIIERLREKGDFAGGEGASIAPEAPVLNKGGGPGCTCSVSRAGSKGPHAAWCAAYVSTKPVTGGSAPGTSPATSSPDAGAAAAIPAAPTLNKGGGRVPCDHCGSELCPHAGHGHELGVCLDRVHPPHAHCACNGLQRATYDDGHCVCGHHVSHHDGGPARVCALSANRCIECSR